MAVAHYSATVAPSWSNKQTNKLIGPPPLALPSQVELLPGGASHDVTLANRERYVALLARHYCCRGSSEAGVSRS